MTAEEWAERFHALLRAADTDGYDVYVDDDFDGQRLEVRVGNGTDDALIGEWNA
jgi:hypothetical protein